MKLLASLMASIVAVSSILASSRASDERAAQASGAISQDPAHSTANMVRIPEGPFWMGRTRLWLIDEIGWQSSIRMDDRPTHRVWLDTFYIDTFEVTQQRYAEFIAETGREPPFHWKDRQAPEQRLSLPIYNVSWHDARAFCQWARGRLPTEAEWEKAARGGIEESAFPWGNEFQVDWDIDGEADAMAHFGYPEGPTEVGRFFPNAYGLYDVIGNVWEWVSDGYQQHYYSISERTNPEGPEAAPYKIFRGGSWADRDDRLLSVFYRNFTDPKTVTNTIGFRCAADAEP